MAAIGFWLMSGTWGLAWVVAGGRFRRIGAALIVGDVVGAGVFLYWVLCGGPRAFRTADLQ